MNLKRMIPILILLTLIMPMMYGQESTKLVTPAFLAELEKALLMEFGEYLSVQETVLVMEMSLTQIEKGIIVDLERKIKIAKETLNQAIIPLQAKVIVKDKRIEILTEMIRELIAENQTAWIIAAAGWILAVIAAIAAALK